MSEPIEPIFADLIERHGGRGSFSPATLAVARTLSAILAAPSDAASARTAVELEKLLPRAPVADQRPLDLARLSDEQLEQLESLMAVMGAKPSVDVCVPVVDDLLHAENRALRAHIGGLERHMMQTALQAEEARLAAVSEKAAAEPMLIEGERSDTGARVRLIEGEQARDARRRAEAASPIIAASDLRLNFGGS